MTDPATVKILVVEDEKFLSNLLKMRLEKEGFSIIQAYDGEEGLSKMKSEAPGLVILDLVMPKVSGFEFLEQASLDPQIASTPIVVATNLGQDSDMEKIKQFSAVKGYFVKAQTPIDELAEIIKNAVSANQ